MATDSKPSAEHVNVWHKVVAGVFGTVLAPVLVTVGIKWSDKLTAPAEEKPAATATAAAPVAPAAAATAPTVTAPAAPAGVATAPSATLPAATAPHAAAPAVTAPVANVSVTAPPAAAGNAPAGSSASAASGSASTGSVSLPQFKKPLSQVQRLFNGRDLTGFYTYIGKPNHRAKPQGKNHDPDKIFTVQDGMIHISGEYLGVLETEKSYSDYWLKVVYKWGEKTWPPEENEARHSAILVAIDGPNGVLRSAFPASFHIQLNEGNAGDFLIAAAPEEEHLSLTAAVEEKRLGKLTSPCYTPGAPKSTFKQGVIKRYPTNTAWHNVKGYQPPNSLEMPTGEWNTMEIVCLHSKIWVRLNDHVCNFAIESNPSAGRIGIQSHGAELFVREMTLQPYNQKPHDTTAAK